MSEDSVYGSRDGFDEEGIMAQKNRSNLLMHTTSPGFSTIILEPILTT